MDVNRFRVPTNPIEQRIQSQRNAQSSDPSGLRPRPTPSTSTNLSPAPNSSQRSTSNNSTRRKVVLDQGCSPLDWARLNSSGQNLRGIHLSEFPVKVTKELLKQHAKQNDCWTVLGRKVYNITPYVKFHPGGIEEIMKCAGRDGTALFNKYHAWVNYETMLKNCLVGIYLG